MPTVELAQEEFNPIVELPNGKIYLHGSDIKLKKAFDGGSVKGLSRAQKVALLARDGEMVGGFMKVDDNYYHIPAKQTDYCKKFFAAKRANTEAGRISKG